MFCPKKKVTYILCFGSIYSYINSFLTSVSPEKEMSKLNVQKLINLPVFIFVDNVGSLSKK